MRVLVVEDEKHLNRIITEAMEDEGYSVDSCFNGADALDYALSAVYDVMILDIMLPKLDGLELVRRLRRGGNHTPVLFLTARDSVADKVEGLESGGDYYLTKPFDFQELIAVVHVMTRKYTGNRSNIYTIADLTLDVSARTVTRAGRSIELTQKEFDLLLYLIRERGRVFTREDLMQKVWNYDYFGDMRTVDVTVRRLREKIEDDPGKPALILTKRGVGYYIQ